MAWKQRSGWGGLLGVVLILAGSSAEAGQTWTVSLNTALLASDYTGPFGLDFELVGTAGNTVTVSDFLFGGGNAGPGAAFLTGGASGDLSTTVALNDSAAFFSDFNQQFTPGTTLSFTIDTTLLAPGPGDTPDNFSIALFSSYDPVNGYNPNDLTGGTPIPTTDPSGNDSFFSFDINGPGATTASSYSGSNGDLPIMFTGAGAVPEPSTVILLAVGLGWLGWTLNRHRRMKPE